MGKVSKVLHGAIALAMAGTMGMGHTTAKAQDHAQPAPPSALPAYTPASALSGMVRISGPRQAAPLIEAWQAAFRQLHPDVRFANSFKGTTNGQYALQEGTADLAVVDRYLGTVEVLGLWRRRGVYEVLLQAARGRYEDPGKAQPLVVYVNKDNPIATLSQHQMTRVFKARTFGERRQYDGGLQWQVDDNRDGRTMGANYIYITQWRELGLSGDWADKPIHVYGPPLASPGWLGPLYTGTGGDMWTERYTELADSRAIVEAVAKDRFAIGRTGMGYANDRVIVLPLPDLAEDANLDRPPPPPNVHYGPAPRGFLDPRQQSFPIMLAYAPVTGKPNAGLSTASVAFLDFALSAQGQAIARKVPKFGAVSVAMANKARKLIGNTSDQRAPEQSSAMVPHLNPAIDGMRPSQMPALPGEASQ